MPPLPEENFETGTWTGSGPAPGKREGSRAVGFGIVGLLIPLLSIFALYFAGKGQRLADEAGLEAPGSVRTGRILGWIGLALMAFWIVVSVATSVTG